MKVCRQLRRNWHISNEIDEQNDLYRESSLLLWLNDELNESEYHLLLEQSITNPSIALYDSTADRDT